MQLHKVQADICRVGQKCWLWYYHQWIPFLFKVFIL